MADTANQRSTRRELAQGRRHDSIGNAPVLGYLDEGDVPRAVGGDEEAPWLKTPPFPSNVVAWFTGVTGGQALTPQVPDLPLGNYVFTAPIDVEQRRVLNVWIDFTAQGDDVTSGLSLVPQVFNDMVSPEGEFWNTVVIDPSLSVLDLSATVLALPGVGSRVFRPAELRSALLAPAGRWRVVIPFDVTPWSRFRLAAGVYGAVGAAGDLKLGYSFTN